MNINKYTDDDICDIYPNRICDNCGDCLKEEGIDVRAIRIEDIAKTIEENEFLEAEYKSMLEALKEEANMEENNEDVEKLKSISMITNFIKVDVCKFGNDSNLLGALYSFRQMYLEN